LFYTKRDIQKEIYKEKRKMLEFLKSFNYEVPKIVENSAPDLNIVKKNGKYELYINGEGWMAYNSNHAEAYQLFSHYYIASGYVISTGLGFAVRELWLLNNPKVKSLTIIEKNQDLIKYHKKINPSIFDKAEIICCDANDYKGKCDTLLLDHYEFETSQEINSNVKKLCNNIECEKMWFWPYESQIINKLREEKNQNIKDVYDSLKKSLGLDKLPNLEIAEIKIILSMFTSLKQIEF
jgi:hypothetical protein